MDKRQQILEAAERVFRNKGLSGATTREIARDAGCAEGTIYLHFQDRLALFSAVLDACVPDLKEPLDGLQNLVGKRTVRLNLEMVAFGALCFYERAQTMVCSAFAEPELLDAQRQALRQAGKGPHTAEIKLAEYIRAEQKIGRVDRRAAAESIGSMLLGACFFRVFVAQYMGEPMSPDADIFVRKLVDNLVRGTKPDRRKAEEILLEAMAR